MAICAFAHCVVSSFSFFFLTVHLLLKSQPGSSLVSFVYLFFRYLFCPFYTFIMKGQKETGSQGEGEREIRTLWAVLQEVRVHLCLQSLGNTCVV